MGMSYNIMNNDTSGIILHIPNHGNRRAVHTNGLFRGDSECAKVCGDDMGDFIGSTTWNDADTIIVGCKELSDCMPALNTGQT